MAVRVMAPEKGLSQAQKKGTQLHWVTLEFIADQQAGKPANETKRPALGLSPEPRTNPERKQAKRGDHAGTGFGDKSQIANDGQCHLVQ